MLRKSGVIGLIVMFLCMASLSYAAQSYDYNGKTYYVVTSTDPAMDTGDEVCRSVGKTCAGFDAFTTDVCKYFHPDAKLLTSVHGSKTGFYCDGPPQTGLACEAQYNTCEICPACNVNIDCGTPIGGLYREMYVTCSGGEPAPEPKCPDIKAKTTSAFMAELSSVHTQIQTCPKTLPGAIAILVSTGTIDTKIAMKDGTTSTFLISLNNKVLVDISDLSGKIAITPYTLITDEESFDAILSSDNKFGTIAYLYNNKKITLRANTFWQKFKFFFVRPFLNIGLRNQGVAPLPPPPAPQQPNLDYPGKWTCDFYQIPYPGVNVKHVSPCTAPMAADNYCKTVLTSPYAKAEVCDDSTGIIVCSNPCEAPVAQIIPRSCPFDSGRPRGNQAAPVQNCPVKPAPAPPGKTPANCMDTYLAGHDAYQFNAQVKALWDDYSSKTRKVCQVLQGMPPAECVYSVQTAKQGVAQPYYLCWYN